jgi:hypothetical protein
MSHRCDKKREDSMARNDSILEKEDPGDIQHYQGLIQKAFMARRKIETGFIELAESIFEINHKKLYKLKYKTFSQFCEEELGFSRQTVYVYISILKLIQLFPDHFPKSKAVEFGHKKMRFIAEGINSIDRSASDETRKTKLKQQILDSVTADMAATEIESKIEVILENI